MKTLKFFLISLFCLYALGSTAQDKTYAAKEKKDKSAKAEMGYKIIEKGAMLSKVTFRQDKKAAGNVIEIEAVNISGGSVSLGNYSSGGGAVLPPATITDIISMTGNYLSTRDVSKSGRGVVMQLVDVQYPYRGRITVSEQVLEFEINEPGFWKISVAVTQ